MWQFPGGPGGLGGTSYCNQGCANSWLADKFCDQACNVLACSFDVGDCGQGGGGLRWSQRRRWCCFENSSLTFFLVEHFGELHRVTLRSQQTVYTLPVGEVRPYFSFEGLAHRVSEAYVEDNPVVRHTSVANKWKTVHLLLHPGHNATQIRYNLTFQREDSSEFGMSFAVAVDTREIPQANVSQSTGKEDTKEQQSTPTPEPLFLFSDVPEDRRGPKVHAKQPGELEAAVKVPPVNVSLLPADVQSELQKLEEKLLIGDITLKGFNITKAELLKSYLSLDEPDARSHPAEIQEKEQPEVSRNALLTPLPVPIDDNPKKDFADPKHSRLDAPIQRPLTSKLLSIPKVRSVRSQSEAATAVVGRRLQHFISADRGFLPWERRKYFQKVLEVEASLYQRALLT